MKEFKYEAHSFREGRHQHRSETITAVDLARNDLPPTYEGFLELINRWNRRGLLGVRLSGITYVYVAEPRR